MRDQVVQMSSSYGPAVRFVYDPLIPVREGIQHCGKCSDHVCAVTMQDFFFGDQMCPCGLLLTVYSFMSSRIVSS